MSSVFVFEFDMTQLNVNPALMPTYPGSASTSINQHRTFKSSTAAATLGRDRRHYLSTRSLTIHRRSSDKSSPGTILFPFSEPSVPESSHSYPYISHAKITAKTSGSSRSAHMIGPSCGSIEDADLQTPLLADPNIAIPAPIGQPLQEPFGIGPR